MDRAWDLGIIKAQRSGNGRKPVRSNLRCGIIDSTGFETRHASEHYLFRIKGHFKRDQYRGWLKLSVAAHSSSHLIVSARVNHGPSPDAPLFNSLLLEANMLLHFDQVLADAGYDAEYNHRFARERLGINSTLIKLNQGRFEHQLPFGKYRREMKLKFKKKAYGQRSQAESIFSRLKRVFGSVLRARSWLGQTHEALLRVLLLNLLLVGSAK